MLFATPCTREAVVFASLRPEFLRGGERRRVGGRLKLSPALRKGRILDGYRRAAHERREPEAKSKSTPPRVSVTNLDRKPRPPWPRSYAEMVPK